MASFKPEYSDQAPGFYNGGIKREGPGYIKTGATAGYYNLQPVGVSNPALEQLHIGVASEEIVTSGGYEQVTLGAGSGVAQTTTTETVTPAVQRAPSSFLSGSNVDPAIFYLGAGLLIVAAILKKGA